METGAKQERCPGASSEANPGDSPGGNEEVSDGEMERWSFASTLQHSNPPTLQISTTPLLPACSSLSCSLTKIDVRETPAFEHPIQGKPDSAGARLRAALQAERPLQVVGVIHAYAG